MILIGLCNFGVVYLVNIYFGFCIVQVQSDEICKRRMSREKEIKNESDEELMSLERWGSQGMNETFEGLPAEKNKHKVENVGRGI